MRFVAATLFFCALSGCTDSSTTSSDLGIEAPGCRAPSACYRTDCECLDGNLASCQTCDPTQQPNQTCDCTKGDMSTSQCLTPGLVCVGRATMACLGVGARCVPANADCSTTEGRPPELVSVLTPGVDAAPHDEPRCAFVTDRCCPGLLVDGGARDSL